MDQNAEHVEIWERHFEGSLCRGCVECESILQWNPSHPVSCWPHSLVDNSFNGMKEMGLTLNILGSKLQIFPRGDLQKEQENSNVGLEKHWHTKHQMVLWFTKFCRSHLISDDNFRGSLYRWKYESSMLDFYWQNPQIFYRINLVKFISVEKGYSDG